MHNIQKKSMLAQEVSLSFSFLKMGGTVYKKCFFGFLNHFYSDQTVRWVFHLYIFVIFKNIFQVHIVMEKL